MKFPLPADTFPTLALSCEQERKLMVAVEMIVKRSIAQYHEHLTVHEGVVDETRWKKTKQHTSVCSFIERRASIDSSASASSSSSSSSATADDVKSMTSILVTGSVPGDLDEILYGMLNTTNEQMQIKSAYLEDGLVDWKLLASIATPNELEPYRDLSLKWSAKNHLMLVGAAMRTRDAVFIESTGVALTPSGERVGYRLLHSVAVDGIRELTELNILRLDLTVCWFVRQKDSKSVEVYGRALIDHSGDIPPTLYALTLVESALLIVKHVHCAEMKKLTRIIDSRARGHSSATGVLSNQQPLSATTCALCEKRLKKMPFARSSKKQCCVCDERICSRCRVHKTIYTLAEPIEKQLTATSVTVCTRCMHRVASSSSHAFAVLDVQAVPDKEGANYCELLQLERFM